MRNDFFYWSIFFSFFLLDELLPGQQLFGIDFELIAYSYSLFHFQDICKYIANTLEQQYYEHVLHPAPLLLLMCCSDPHPPFLPQSSSPHTIHLHNKIEWMYIDLLGQSILFSHRCSLAFITYRYHFDRLH